MLGDHSFILTQRGYIRPNRLKKDDILYTENGCKQSYVHLVNKGDLIEITWFNGLVEQYTPEHCVKVLQDSGKYKWKAIKDLTHEDLVPIYLGKHNVKLSKPKVDIISGLDTNSTTFAYMAGSYLGGYNVIDFEEVLFRHFGTIENKYIPDWVFTEWDVEVISSFLDGYLEHASETEEDGQLVLVENRDILEKLSLMFTCTDIYVVIHKNMNESYTLRILNDIKRTNKVHICMSDKKEVKGNYHIIQTFPFNQYLSEGIPCSEFN